MEAAERKFFPKSERLSFKRDIDHLFDNGQSFISFPLRIVYLPVTGDNHPEPGISALVCVPKKRIKHAVDRNRIKRLIRESFRLNKSEITDFCIGSGKLIHIGFMYVSNDVLPYPDMEKAMRKALYRICRQENAKE